MESVCSDVLEAHFRSNPFREFPVLETFRHEPSALLASLARDGVDIPGDPDEPAVPSMLLWDLRNDEHKNSDVYRYIDSNKDKAPTALYGTSGAGKTRAIFEYLSHNKGLYLLAGTSKRDPGSEDLRFILREQGILALTNDHDQSRSYTNLMIIRERLQVLIYVRHAVHDKITELMGRSPTAYEWLLLQLYPEKFLGGDIFWDATVKCTVRADTSGAESALFSVESTWPAIFVDEAQKLLKVLNYHFLSEETMQIRSAFLALLKGFLQTGLGKKMGYPVFSGTRLSIDDIKTESNSAMAKHTISKQSQIDPFFVNFEPLDARDVESYLNSFLDFNQVGSDVTKHVCNWLRGRPRWTANFLEVYLVRRSKVFKGTRGTFNDSEAKMVQALDRYLAVMTTKEMDAGDRRHSRSAGETSAYYGIERIMSMKNMFLVQKSLETAIFDFAVGGKPTYLREEPKRLIEIGVAALSPQKEREDYVGVLNEPIVVQAGINYCNLDYALQDHILQQEAGGQGEGFEQMMLPGIQKNLEGLVKRQLKNQYGFDKFFDSSYSVSSRSSYGVLAVDCKGDIAGTINWIDSAVSARFEGLVAPFCYPDDHFGPDVLFLMWNEEYTKFRAVLTQGKFRTRFNQLDALRTLVPEWLYNENRDKPTKRKRSSKMNENLWKAWEEAKAKLVGNSKPCLRLMVQYPANATKPAAPGRFHEDDVAPCEDASCKRNHDWLATVSGDNGGELFGEKTARVLKRLKGDDKDKK